MTGSISFPPKQITFSLGSGHNLGRSKNHTEPIRKYVRRFEKPTVTPEKHREYLKSSDQRQRHLKGTAGWFIRAGVEGGVRNRNSIKPSQIITLDIDYATPEFVEELLAGNVLPGVLLIAHSTRSHTPENPRLRIIIFLKGAVESERYGAASRIVAQLADPEMQYVDKVSFRPAQMMYMPTVSADMEKHYVFYQQAGDLLDHDAAIRAWERKNGSSEDIGNLPRAQGEDELREVAEAAEDPLEKKGVVGDFCRAYSITDLVMGVDGEDGMLAEIYEPVEWSADGSISRMTYLHGTTSNGAVVYEDKWVFSHHGSDPCQEQLVNAYDLVRTHLYGDKDAKAEHDTPVSKLPSSEAMRSALRDDERFREQQAESRYELDAKFDDDDVQWDEPDAEDESDENDDIESLVGVPAAALSDETKIGRARRAERPPKKWIAKQLELTDDGIIKTTTPNLTTIVTNDPRLWRRIAYNDFLHTVVLVENITTKLPLVPNLPCTDRVNGNRWQDIFDMTIKALVESPTKGGKGYGIKVGKEAISDAIVLAGLNNRFHPVKEFLAEAHDDEGWDGVSRVETFLIDYVGAEDNSYTRQAMKMMAVASVARIFEPGCKFDFAIILEGKQGTGKSTAIKRLYGADYFGELHANMRDSRETAEQMQGKWVLELPELSSMHKSEANDAKAFITRQHDDARMAYGRHVSNLPRQCVFWGTTNDKSYLRDATGNRRWWPIECNIDSIDTLGIMRNRRQFWAEAVAIYMDMRREQPNGELDLSLKGRATKIAEKVQHSRRTEEVWEQWKQRVEDFMEEPIPLKEYLSQQGEVHVPLEWGGMDTERTWVRRVTASTQELWQLALGFREETPKTAPDQNNWNHVVNTLEEDGWTKERRVIRRRRATYYTDPMATPYESKNGFKIVDPPDGDGESPLDRHFHDEDVAPYLDPEDRNGDSLI